ncbi:MAG: hypothetical protein V4737_14485 [Curtobacterium sp.]
MSNSPDPRDSSGFFDSVRQRSERSHGEINTFWSSPAGTLTGLVCVVLMVGGVVLGVTGVL